MEPLYRSPSWPRPNHELKFIDTDEEDVPCKAGEVHLSDSVEQRLSQRAALSMSKHVDDALPLASCRIDGPGKCLLTEMPAAPAASAVSAYTEEGMVSLWCLTKITSTSRFSDATTQLVHIVGNALKPELPAVDATPALSSVCRHGEAAEEDTEDGSDTSDGVTMNSATVPSFEERSQYLCPPTATVSEVEQASSNTDDELSEAVEPAAGHKCELEPSVHENLPRALSLQAAWSAQGDATSSCTPPEGYHIVLEPAPMYCCDKAILQGCRRRGRPSAGDVEEDSEPLTRRTRRVAAELAAVTVTAAARDDVVDNDDSEDELDDVELEGEVTLSEEEDGEDEEYIARGGSGCGTKRNRHGPSPCGRNVRRLVSGSVCRECGIDKTPQWRIGPEGPRTLCNACGVRYKKVQKSQSRTKIVGRNRR